MFWTKNKYFTLQYEENKEERRSESTELSLDESPRNDYLSEDIYGATNFIQESYLQSQEQKVNIQIGIGIQDEQIPNPPNLSNSINGQIKRQTRNSVLWLFYKPIEGDMSKVKCNQCARVISRGRKTQKLGNGSMSPHLRVHHPYEYKKYLLAKESKDAKEANEAEEEKLNNSVLGP